MLASDAALFAQGLDYLYDLRALLEPPDLIDLVVHTDQRQAVCTRIGAQIEPLNAYLGSLVEQCACCFHPWQVPTVEVRAAPLADAFAIDGFCLLTSRPILLVLDVGRVLPQDWLALVAHEYSHAVLGHPGHAQAFAETLSHLCRALALPLPATALDAPARWQTLPPYRTTRQPLDFWSGHADLPFALTAH